jgi:hypothetical protein
MLTCVAQRVKHPHEPAAVEGASDLFLAVLDARNEARSRLLLA